MKSKFTEIISIVVLFLFMYTAINKLFDYQAFVRTLEAIPVVKHYSGVIAVSVIIAELISSFLLAIKKTRNIGLYLSACMFMGFNIYLLYMVNNHENLPCSCGGIISYLNWNQHIILNFILMTGCIVGAFYARSKSKDSSTRIPPPSYT